jgi:hypothetical protein
MVPSDISGMAKSALTTIKRKIIEKKKDIKPIRLTIILDKPSVPESVNLIKKAKVYKCQFCDVTFDKF